MLQVLNTNLRDNPFSTKQSKINTSVKSQEYPQCSIFLAFFLSLYTTCIEIVLKRENYDGQPGQTDKFI